MRASFAAVGLVLISSQSFAEETKPNSVHALIESCRSYMDSTEMTDAGNAFARGRCVGVTTTLVWLAPALNVKQRFCPPKDVTYGQVVRIALDFMDRQPHRHDEDFTQLVHEAYLAAWPCHSNISDEID